MKVKVRVGEPLLRMRVSSGLMQRKRARPALLMNWYQYTNAAEVKASQVKSSEVLMLMRLQGAIRPFNDTFT